MSHARVIDLLLVNVARKIYSSSRFGTRYSRLENTRLRRVDSRV